MTGTPSRTARVPIVRWDLKEAEGKILTRGTRIACEASCRGARTRRCPKPSVIRNGPVYMRRVWKEGHASYPGRSACLPRARAAERESDGRAEVSRGQKGRRSDPRPEQVNPARCRGLEAARARKATATGRGAWWNAGASHMHAAVNNRLLAVWGLLNLLTQLRDLQRRT